MLGEDFDLVILEFVPGATERVKDVVRKVSSHRES